MFETKTFKLKTLSPIHIKGKDVDYGQGFVRAHKNPNFAYAIDQNKLAEFLIEKECFDDYMQEIDDVIKRKRFRSFSIESFLKHRGLYPDEEDDMIAKGVFRGMVNAVQHSEFIKSGRGIPFIPGSSIKGAFRTAVLFKMVQQKITEKSDWLSVIVINKLDQLGKKKIDLEKLKREKTQEKDNYKRRDISFKIKRLEREIDIFKGHFDEDLTFNIFQALAPTSFPENIKKGPNTDFFRALKVSDSQPIDFVKKEKTTAAKEIKVLNVSGSGIGRVVHKGIAFSLVDMSNPDSVLVPMIPNKLILEGNLQDGDVASFEIDKHGKIMTLKKEKIEAPQKSDKESVESRRQPISRETVIILSLQKGRSAYEKPGTRENIECFSGETTFKITLDTYLIREFCGVNPEIPFKSLKELLKITEDFAHAQWEYEKAYFDEIESGTINIKAMGSENVLYLVEIKIGGS